MREIERYRVLYFEDCVELLKNKHSYRKHVDKFIDYLKKAGLENRPRVIDKKVVEDCIGYYRLERGGVKYPFYYGGTFGGFKKFL